MSRVSKMLAVAMGLVLWVGPAIAGDDVESELAEMRRLMEGLQQKVEAQEEQLSQQSRNLEEAQRVVRRTQEDTEAVSGLSSFLNSLEVDGHVAVSYAYNLTNNPDNSQALAPGNGNAPAGPGLNQGVGGGFYPFHGDHDSFQVDQIWFGLGKPATEESRAGFRFDMLYGNTAFFLGNGSPAGARNGGSGGSLGALDSTNDFYISQAYVEYLAPIGDGVMFRGGKFGTLVGAEVAKTTDNFNVTRGNLYNLLQPIDHVGVLASTDVGPFSLTVGGANSQTLGVGAPDDNDVKTLLGSIGVGDDALSGTATVIWGSENGVNKDDVGFFDVLVSSNPSDNLSLWLNFNYLWAEGGTNTVSSGDEITAWGIAAAGRLALTEQMGFSLRGEYVGDNSGFLGIKQAGDPSAGLRDEGSVWGITATLDYTVVEDLLLRLESRYDRVNASGHFFESSGVANAGLDRDQWILLAEAVYTF